MDGGVQIQDVFFIKREQLMQHHQLDESQYFNYF